MGTIAIVRGVADALASCELSFVERAPIDVALARQQHSGYVEALLALGCEVLELPPLAGFGDSVFVEDTALVLDELAILTRPGAQSRRGEVDSIGEVLANLRPIARIDGGGTLDGGDVLRIGKSIYVGQAARSNAAGFTKLVRRPTRLGGAGKGAATRGD